MQPIPQSNDDDQSHQGISNIDEPKLVMWQGSALLSAECVGVGILALPHDIKVLGWAFGLTFLVINFPINYIAGNFLSILALDIENCDTHDDAGENEVDELTNAGPQSDGEESDETESECRRSLGKGELSNREKSVKTYSVIANHDDEEEDDIVEDIFQDEDLHSENDTVESQQNPPESQEIRLQDTSISSSKTSDLISISEEVYQSNCVTKSVLLIYYLNLFLVLGDYILVMSKSVSAIFLDRICTPVAGVIASTLIFAICQLKTMSNLGRKVSVASLVAMMVVLMQCLFHHRSSSSSSLSPSLLEERQSEEEDPSIWQKFGAFASIGFAVGSQKLFLNVRHELKEREQASKALAWSLITYGNIYLLVILLAGSNPPSFLFDAIPEGISRQVAGLLLWGHVAVSYAINCQALCSSVDRFIVLHYLPNDNNVWFGDPGRRWLALTFGVALASYLVSNAIPFFKDLVALIGALTSVPLTLTLPALLHRKANNLTFLNFCESLDSYAILIFSLIFFVVGLIGAVSSIDQDWLNHGGAFSCH